MTPHPLIPLILQIAIFFMMVFSVRLQRRTIADLRRNEAATKELMDYMRKSNAEFQKTIDEAMGVLEEWREEEGDEWRRG